MEKTNMPHYGGKRIEGFDYSRPARELILESIAHISKTNKEVAEHIGRRQSSVIIVMNTLYKEGLVYLARWKRGKSGPISPCYRIGNKTDAQRPLPLTTAEKSARYRSTEHGMQVSIAARDAYQHSEHGMEKRTAYNKAYYARNKAKSKGLIGIDPLMAMIYGRPKHEPA